MSQRYESKVRKEIAKKVFGDIGKVVLTIACICLAIGCVCGVVWGAYRLLFLIPNDYLYLTIVEGFLGLCTIVGVSISHYNDESQYKDNIPLNAYMKTTTSKILYPILNFVVCLGFVYVLKLASAFVFEGEDDTFAARAATLSIILLVMLLVKFCWYSLDPIGTYIRNVFHQADDLQKELNMTEEERNKMREERIKKLEKEADELRKSTTFLNSIIEKE